MHEDFFREIDRAWRGPRDAKIELRVLSSAALMLQTDYTDSPDSDWRITKCAPSALASADEVAVENPHPRQDRRVRAVQEGQAGQAHSRPSSVVAHALDAAADAGRAMSGTGE